MASLLACALLATAGQSPVPTSQSVGAGASLLRNGDFEQTAAGARLPAQWATAHPENVRLIDAGDEHGQVVEMTGGKKLMASYGVDLISETKIPVKPNARYRCAGWTRSDGPRMKVFVRGYATVTRMVDGQPQTFGDAVYTMRKDIDPTADWQPFNLEFDITPADVFSDFQHQIEYVRVKLWAYWPVGTCWFDDIRFEEVGPVSAENVRRPDAVTHTGRPPRLKSGATSAPVDETLDEEQVWLAAANAFRADEFARAAELGERLVSHAPRNGDYRVLMARTLLALKRWAEADRHARWLLEAPVSQPARAVKPWQRDWALVVRAEVCWRTGRGGEARKLAEGVVREDASPHARQAAEELLRQMKAAEAR